MSVDRRTFKVSTKGDCDIVDITPQVRSELTNTDISLGTLTVFVAGSTCGVTTIEYESGAVCDLQDAIERIAPQDINYAHNARWGDGHKYGECAQGYVSVGKFATYLRSYIHNITVTFGAYLECSSIH